MNDVQQRRLDLEKTLWDANMALSQIKKDCKHINISKGRLMWSPRHQKIYQTHKNDPCRSLDDDCVSMYCQDCGKEFGWFCTVNPKGYCEYNWMTSEDCIFCHQPEERK